MKYFSIDRIKAACRHLENYKGNWIIPAFVLACNGVNQSFVDLTKNLGTDKFLDQYFSGSLIGLPEFGKKKNSLRPRFKEIVTTLKREGHEADFVVHQTQKLWANAYSSRGYREMEARGYLEAKGASIWKLSPSFAKNFKKEIPKSFRFEEFLVWLFAFSGFPDEINDWNTLYRHFLDTTIGKGKEFPAEYNTRFRISTSPTVEWPSDLLTTRPLDEVFRWELIPSYGKNPPAFLEESDPIWQLIQRLIKDKGWLNFLFYGPPGTGKTWYAKKISERLVDNDPERRLIVQFHPSFSYDDFVEGYVPITHGDSVSYEPRGKHFVRFCERARSDSGKLYIIVIDEISRGDPSRIFGELLTYIEEDYREDSFSLAYSAEPFSIPRNLVIIGTTNPYDRSVSELDDALVRRFHHIEFKPDAKLLARWLKDDGVEAKVIKKILHFFRMINEKLPFGFGHAQFFGIKNDEDFQNVWEHGLKFQLERALSYEEDKLSELEQLAQQLFGSDRKGDGAAVEGDAEIVQLKAEAGADIEPG